MSFHTLHTFCRYCAVFIFAIASLNAKAQDDTSHVQLNLTTLAWKQPVKGIYYMNDGRVEELKAYSGGFSIPFSYKGESIIQFYSDKESPLLELQDRPPPVGIAKLNPNHKHALLIFISKENGHYQIMEHDFSQDEFPPLSCRIFNFSDLKVIFAFGDQAKTYTVDPHEVIVVHQDGMADKNQMVKVQVAQDEEGELRLVYRSSWRFDEQSRNTVFIVPGSSERRSVKMRKFVERGL